MRALLLLALLAGTACTERERLLRRVSPRHRRRHRERSGRLQPNELEKANMYTAKNVLTGAKLLRELGHTLKDVVTAKVADGPTPSRIIQAVNDHETQALDLNHDFGEYTMLCSHNSYAWGRQSNIDPKRAILTATESTDTGTMPLLLNAGYRCIELDVWVRNFKISKDVVVVGHLSGVKDMTNHVPLVFFLQSIVKWLEEDEDGTTSKLPIAISVENHAGEHPEGFKKETEMADLFHSAFGDRIVLPSEFAKGTTLNTLASTKRRVWC